jgi:3-hydroxyisobutyrate dehydrogenase-like beta-hydroxyacid dehydrogenase
MQRSVIGFIGLGVMGEPICRNMARKTGHRFVAYDLKRDPLDRLSEHGVASADSFGDVIETAEMIFLSLPGGSEVEQIVAGAGGILHEGRAGQIVVDLSTTPVDLTRRLARALSAVGIAFADAPVARTRQAAEDGTLSIMVGADPAVFEAIRPFLAAAGSDLTLCGDVGCGQVVKLLNNMVLFETVVALAEALAIGETAGVDRRLLFETLSKGSADSFALRNHGMKAMLADKFPLGAFPTDYAVKDASYALALAEHVGIEARGARLALDILKQTSRAGFGREYFPVLARLVGRSGTVGAEDPGGSQRP